MCCLRRFEAQCNDAGNDAMQIVVKHLSIIEAQVQHHIRPSLLHRDVELSQVVSRAQLIGPPPLVQVEANLCCRCLKPAPCRSNTAIVTCIKELDRIDACHIKFWDSIHVTITISYFSTCIDKTAGVIRHTFVQLALLQWLAKLASHSLVLPPTVRPH